MRAWYRALFAAMRLGVFRAISVEMIASHGKDRAWLEPARTSGQASVSCARASERCGGLGCGTRTGGIMEDDPLQATLPETDPTETDDPRSPEQRATPPEPRGL